MNKPKLIAIFISIVAVLWANAGYIYGLLSPIPGMYFLGRRVINSVDTYTYISFIEQAKQGRWIFANQFTTEAQEPLLVRPLFVFLGRIADVFALSSRDAFIFGIIGFSFLFCFILYKFLGKLFTNEWKKVFTFAIVLTSTGFGFFLNNLFPQSIDLWIPEANTFLSLGEAPHFIFSQILMLVAFMFFISGIEEKRVKHFLISVGALFLLVFEHPFNIFVTFTVMGILTVIFERRKMVSQKMASWIILVFLVQIGGVLYHLQGTITNQVLGQWYQANSLPSPSPLNFLIGYGLLIPFAILGLEKFLSRQTAYKLLIIAWVLVTFVLLYSPLSFQRRVSEGLHIPLSILASVGILAVGNIIGQFVVEQARKKVVVIFTVTVLVVMSFGSMWVSSQDILAIRSDNINQYVYHIRNGEKQAMDILAKNTTFNDVIFSNVTYGNLIPGITGRKTYVGHGVQTHDIVEKINDANAFLLEKDDKKAYEFLKKHGITFIFLSVNDPMLEYGFRPDLKPFLELSYNNNGILIYHVYDPVLNQKGAQNQPQMNQEQQGNIQPQIEEGVGAGVGEAINGNDVNIFLPAPTQSPESLNSSEETNAAEEVSPAPIE